MQWPSVDKVKEYRKQVYDAVVDVIENHPAFDTIADNHTSPFWAVVMGYVRKWKIRGSTLPPGSLRPCRRAMMLLGSIAWRPRLAIICVHRSAHHVLEAACHSSRCVPMPSSSGQPTPHTSCGTPDTPRMPLHAPHTIIKSPTLTTASRHSWHHPCPCLCCRTEHERIHLETSSVLMRELAVDLVRRPEEWPDIHPTAFTGSTATTPHEGIDYPVNTWYAGAGATTLARFAHLQIVVRSCCCAATQPRPLQTLVAAAAVATLDSPDAAASAVGILCMGWRLSSCAASVV